LDLLLDGAVDLDFLAVDADFLAVSLRLRRDEAAETTGAHTSASKQMATNAEVKRAIISSE
jgi:hypothetical protein